MLDNEALSKEPVVLHVLAFFIKVVRQGFRYSLRQTMLISSNELFLTRRPELFIQLGFKNIFTVVYQDMVLQDEVSQTKDTAWNLDSSREYH